MWKLIVLATLVAVPRWCAAGESCLWLNEPTAAGILGGAVNSRVSHLTHDMPGAGTANAKSSAGPMNANAAAPNYATTSADDEDCTFTRRAGAILEENARSRLAGRRPTSGSSCFSGAAPGGLCAWSEIRIEVRTMYQSRMEFTSRLATCGNDKVSLRAIGNEALACDSGKNSEQVVGRVRDRAFLVRVTTNDTATDRATLRESAKTAAEIVSGNLF